MITCQNIQKSYQKQLVLKGVNLECESGKIHVLLGKSGSGKSTLLKIITKLMDADAGQVVAPDMGLVFQQHNLWPHLNILSNLTLAPIKVLKQPKQEAIKKAKQLLAQFGLAEKALKFPKELSGGEQQRCAIMRCLMMPYEALALDEPSAALDPQSSQQVAQALLALKQQGKSLLVSTHDLTFASQIADKIYYMHHGEIIETGTVYCLKQPATQALKQYLGEEVIA